MSPESPKRRSGFRVLPRVTRRGLFGVAMIAGVGAVTAPFVAFAGDRPRRRTIARYLRQRLPDLVIADAELDRYAQDFLANNSVVGSRMFTLAMQFPQLIFAADGAGVLPHLFQVRLANIESEFLVQFFAGSDYMQVRGTGEPVNYYGYPDPYELGCANPMARFDANV